MVCGLEGENTQRERERERVSDWGIVALGCMFASDTGMHYLYQHDVSAAAPTRVTHSDASKIRYVRMLR